MVAWQKRARLLVLVVAVGVAAVVFATTRRREPPAPPKPTPRADPSAIVESSGAFVIQVKGTKENFRIDAKKQLLYSDGSTKLLGVKVTSIRQGKTFVAEGDEAKVTGDESHTELTGNVRLSASDGLAVTAGSATHSRSEGIVRAPGPVTFKRGRMSGSGVGFSYDENRDQIGLSERTAITIAPDNKGANSADIRAGSALFARKDKFVSLHGAVHIVRPNQIIDADSAVADLSADEEHLTALELQGNARIATVRPAPGGLSAMAADVINLTYTEKSDRIEKATLSSAASLRVAGNDGGQERQLSGATIEVGLAADGTTVTSLTAREKVVLDLPAPKGQPAKSIHANSLVGTGKAETGLTSAVFTDSVEYRETGGAPAVQRVVRSRSLETALNGGIGEIREAHFSGEVTFRDGRTEASAANVRYQVASGQVELRGNVKGALPQVANDEIVVDASTIDMTLEGPKLRAVSQPDQVRTVLKPVKAGSKGDTRKTPALMQQDQPVLGWSNEFLYDGGKNSTAEFIGAVRLQQKETSIKGDKVLLDGKTGNLTALGKVASVFLVQDVNPTTNVRETTRSAGSGQEMYYDEAAHKVTYKIDAGLDGSQGKLTAKTIDLYLGKNGQDVERMEATGDVTLVEADRITKGNQLNYVAESQEYVMSGGTERPVQMLSRGEDGCQENTGNVLTFSRATDSLRINGQESSRTESKSVGCSGLGLPAPPKTHPGTPAPRQ